MIGCKLQEFQPRVKLNSTCSVAGRAGPASQCYRGRLSDVFAHACKMDSRRHRVEAQGLALPQRPLAGLDQEQEPSLRGGLMRRACTAKRQALQALIW